MGNNFLPALFRSRLFSSTPIVSTRILPARVSSPRFLALRRNVFACFAIVLWLGAAAFAQQKQFEFDPAQTKVSYTVGSTLHTVHGNFKLKRGTIKLDEATGQASGELIVDASSGDSGNHSRDSKMNKDILESQKFSEIIFTPQRFKGPLAGPGKSHLEVEGQFTIHGQAHPMTLLIDADLSGGAGATADTEFDVPYQKWGMKNPSTFILRVDNKVQIHIHAVAKQVAAARASSR